MVPSSASILRIDDNDTRDLPEAIKPAQSSVGHVVHIEKDIKRL
jgi:hypothetical protein